MKEDDLLGEERDLRRHLQWGARNFGEGAQGRRVEGVSNLGATMGD